MQTSARMGIKTKTTQYANRILILLIVLLLISQAGFAQRSDERTMQDFQKMGLTFFTDNEVKIIPSGEEMFKNLFEDVRNAKSYVYLDFFKFQEDSICNALFNILQDKVRQGVSIRVVYDSFANSHSAHPLSGKFVDRMRRAGIQIYPFDEMRFPWVNHLLHRNHHKIAVIDGRVAYSGGMNVADYYLHGRPNIGHWRDMHMRLTGNVVRGYEEVFAGMWYKLGKEYIYLPEEVEDYATGTKTIALVNRIPHVSPAIMRRTYSAAIDNAQEIVQIVNPYPTIFGEVKRSIFRAMRRGVKVQIMVSEKSDVDISGDVVGLEMHRLMKRGAEVYCYQGGFHHSKVMMVDGLFCTVGTANLNSRSLIWDYEVNAFVFDKGTTAELQDIFEKDKQQHCFMLTSETWKKWFPVRRRIKAGLSAICKKVM